MIESYLVTKYPQNTERQIIGNDTKIVWQQTMSRKETWTKTEELCVQSNDSAPKQNWKPPLRQNHEQPSKIMNKLTGKIKCKFHF